MAPSESRFCSEFAPAGTAPGNGWRRTKPQSESETAETNGTFRFVPRELATKCRRLIESYHAMHGFGSLPDMLWHSDARDLIECHRELALLFKTASKSRGAKRANDKLLAVATTIASMEMLARDFAGWGWRFPEAKQEAERLLGNDPLRQRIWLMDLYLYPIGIHRDLVSTLAPSPAAEPMLAGN
jgi:hypothetical protein